MVWCLHPARPAMSQSLNADKYATQTVIDHFTPMFVPNLVVSFPPIRKYCLRWTAADRTDAVM